jgi:hypothetical protein
MKRTSLPLLGWMAPLRHRDAKLVFLENHQNGAIHERDYDNRT